MRIGSSWNSLEKLKLFQESFSGEKKTMCTMAKHEDEEGQKEACVSIQGSPTSCENGKGLLVTAESHVEKEEGTVVRWSGNASGTFSEGGQTWFL